MEAKVSRTPADQTEISQRHNWASHFLEHVFGITEYVITDLSILSDFQDSDDTEDIRQTTFKIYGFTLQKHHFSMRLWKLLDELEENRFRSELEK